MSCGIRWASFGRALVFRLAVGVTFWRILVDNVDADTVECWETRMAQEIYRLIIFDFCVSRAFVGGKPFWLKLFTMY
jgi:hypothetical protein